MPSQIKVPILSNSTTAADAGADAGGNASTSISSAASERRSSADAAPPSAAAADDNINKKNDTSNDDGGNGANNKGDGSNMRIDTPASSTNKKTGDTIGEKNYQSIQEEESSGGRRSEQPKRNKHVLLAKIEIGSDGKKSGDSTSSMDAELSQSIQLTSSAAKMNDEGDEKLDNLDNAQDNTAATSCNEHLDEPCVESIAEKETNVKKNSNDAISMAEDGVKEDAHDKLTKRGNAEISSQPKTKLHDKEGRDAKEDESLMNIDESTISNEIKSIDGKPSAVDDIGNKASTTTKVDDAAKAVGIETFLEMRTMSSRSSATKDDDYTDAPLPNKKQRKGGEKSCNDNEEEERFVTVSLKLPIAPQKFGLTLRDDLQHFGIPILVALKPDSPFCNVIPSRIINNNYSIISVKDDVLGFAHTTSSKVLQEELKKRQDQKEEREVEIMFARRDLAKDLKEETDQMYSANALAVEQQWNEQLQQRFMIQQMMQNMFQRQQQHHQQQQLVQIVEQQQQLKQQLEHELSKNQLIMQQQQYLQEEQSQAAALVLPLQKNSTKAKEKSQSPKTNDPDEDEMKEETKNDKRERQPNKSNPSDGEESNKKQEQNATMPNDETIRKVFNDYFVVGENRSLKQFCEQYSTLYPTILSELSKNRCLCQLQMQRDARGKDNAQEGGFTEDERKLAVKYINGLFSKNFREMKGQHQESVQPKRRGYMPPLEDKEICQGVQHPMLDKYCANPESNKELLYEKARLTNFRGWRSQNCLFNACLDKKGRCLKCRNVYHNIRSDRTPFLFEEPDPPKAPGPPKPPKSLTTKEMLLPKKSTIRECIQKRIESLDPDDIPNDPELVLITRVMKIMGLSKIELDNEKAIKSKNLFAICEDCGVHLLRKQRTNKSFVCRGCVWKRETKKTTEKRMKLNKEDRVKPESTVPISALTHKEAQQRYNNLKKLYKEVTMKLKRSEAKATKKEAKEKDKSVPKAQVDSGRQDNDCRGPLLPWPFYLNYNPIVAQEYSLPTTAPASASITMVTSNLVTKEALRYVRKRKRVCSESGPVADAVTKENKKAAAISGLDGRPHEEEMAVNMTMVDIADDPLDYASIGSSQEEENTPAVAEGKGKKPCELDGHLV